MTNDAATFDYHGALVVVETDAGEVVLIHPAGVPSEAPASLPSNPCRPGEIPEDGAVRIVRELTASRSRSSANTPTSSKKEPRPARCSPIATSLGCRAACSSKTAPRDLRVLTLSTPYRR